MGKWWGAGRGRGVRVGVGIRVMSLKHYSKKRSKLSEASGRTRKRESATNELVGSGRATWEPTAPSSGHEAPVYTPTRGGVGWGGGGCSRTSRRLSSENSPAPCSRTRRACRPWWGRRPWREEALAVEIRHAPRARATARTPPRRRGRGLAG